MLDLTNDRNVFGNPERTDASRSHYEYGYEVALGSTVAVRYHDLSLSLAAFVRHDCNLHICILIMTNKHCDFAQMDWAATVAASVLQT
jgi:hypothetical protein